MLMSMDELLGVLGPRVSGKSSYEFTSTKMCTGGMGGVGVTNSETNCFFLRQKVNLLVKNHHQLLYKVQIQTDRDIGPQFCSFNTGSYFT